MMSTRRLRARWVFPVDAPPIENGAIELDGGRIVALHGRDDTRAEDLGNVALIPGLVNAHAHLEFSDLTEPVQPAEPFTGWIRSLVATRRGRSTPAAESVNQGQRESSEAGVTTIGEIGTSDSHQSLSATGPQLVLFRELLGLVPDRLPAQLAVAREHLSQRLPTGVAKLGLSPHAPFSVHPQLFRDLVALAGEFNAPLAVHLAETTAELELLRDGTGEFVEMLKGFGAWDPQAIPRESRPLDYLRELVSLPTSLAIHGNYLGDEDITFLAAHPQIAVVYCPRTHAFFGHPPHPWRKMLDKGVSLAIGTDGRGSNPDLSLWRELQLLREIAPELPPTTLLTLGTLAGANALGIGHETGSLTPGKRADISVASLDGSTETDPAASLFASERVCSLESWLKTQR